MAGVGNAAGTQRGSWRLLIPAPRDAHAPHGGWNPARCGKVLPKSCSSHQPALRKYPQAGLEGPQASDSEPSLTTAACWLLNAASERRELSLCVSKSPCSSSSGAGEEQPRGVTAAPGSGDGGRQGCCARCFTATLGTGSRGGGPVPAGVCRGRGVSGGFACLFQRGGCSNTQTRASSTASLPPSARAAEGWVGLVWAANWFLGRKTDQRKPELSTGVRLTKPQCHQSQENELIKTRPTSRAALEQLPQL